MTSAHPTDAIGFDTVVAGQRDLAHRCFGQARMVYNQALHRPEAAHRGGQKLSINRISQPWTQFKAAHPEHSVPSSIDGRALRHLDSAFQHFFRRVKLGQKPGYPTPKDARSPEQCSLSIDPRHQSKAEAWARGELHLPGFGLCRVRGLRPGGSEPKTVTLSRDATGRDCISFNNQRAPTALSAPSEGWHSEVGVDLGITTLATLSTGEKIQTLATCSTGSRRSDLISAS